MPHPSRTVLITGAAGHLGRSVARAFDEAGAALVLLDRDAAALQSAFGGDAERRMLAPADLLDAAAVQAAAAAARARFGRIDVLCHVAGGFRMGEAVHETADETWHFLYDVNVRGLIHTVRAVVPGMIAAGGGAVVTVGALASRQGVAKMGAYCAAKDAVLRLTESMAAELGAHGIRANCVLPSIIDTPANRAAMPDADPAGWVSPQAIAETIVWLASDRARAVNGVGLPVTAAG